MGYRIIIGIGIGIAIAIGIGTLNMWLLIRGNASISREGDERSRMGESDGGE